MAIRVEGADEYVAKTLEDLFANLQFMRAKRGLTYKDLGTRAGLTERTAIVTVKGQQQPSSTTLAQLAHGLQVPLADLFMDQEKFAERYKKAKALPPLTLSSERERGLSALYAHAAA